MIFITKYNKNLQLLICECFTGSLLIYASLRIFSESLFIHCNLRLCKNDCMHQVLNLCMVIRIPCILDLILFFTKGNNLFNHPFPQMIYSKKVHRLLQQWMHGVVIHSSSQHGSLLQSGPYFNKGNTEYFNLSNSLFKSFLFA